MISTGQPPARTARPSLGRLWWGLVFVVLGVLGLFAVAGMTDWDGIVGRWWPVAFVGWAVAEMLEARRVTTAGAVIVAIGSGVLADNLDWPGRGLVWSALFLAIGATVLWRSRPTDRANADQRRPSWWGRCCS
jgi:hypothetical protein